MKLKEKLLSLDLVIDNEYLDKYCELIESNKDTKREKFKTQKHHIIPRYYYKYNNLEVDNSKENIVNLSHIDHILAHLMLCKCSSNYYMFANSFALNRLLKVGNNYFNINLELSEDYKNQINFYIQQSQLCRSNLTHNQHKEGKANISGLNNHRFNPKGKIFVVNENEDRHLISSSELDYYIKKGYIKGKYYNKENNPHTGKSLTEEQKKKISFSNKGKSHPTSIETKIKISEKLKGREHPWCIKSGESRKNKNYRWWTNGEIEILSTECPGKDFLLGKKNRPNRKWYNDGYIEKWQENCPEGFTEGRLKRK